MTILRKQLINIGHMLSGNIMNMAVMMVSVSVAARALGPASYGVMILVLSYVRLIERLLRFESWQPLIKYMADIGPVDGDRGRADALGRLCLFGLILDILACFLSALLAVFLAVTVGGLFGLDPQYMYLIVIYACGLLANISGLPTAALRFAGRFRTIAYCQIIANVLRAIGAVYCWWAGYGLVEFMIVWTLCQMMGAAIFFWLGMRALRDQGVTSPFSTSPFGLHRQFDRFLSFGFSTNLSSALRTLTQEADSLLVGALTGPAAAGFYYLAKRLAKIAMQVGAQVQAVLYPDLARLWSNGERERFRRMTLQIQAALAAVGFGALFVAWALGKWAISLAWGNAYLDTYPLFLAQLVAVILVMHASASRSALLSMGYPGRILMIAFVGTMTFFAVATILIPIIGPIGANIAHICLGLITAIGLDYYWLSISGGRMKRPVPV